MKDFLKLVEQDNRLNAALNSLEEQEFIDQAEVFLKTLRSAGEYVDDPEERDWLAATARNWGRFLNDKTGIYYPVGLSPYKGQTVQSDVTITREESLMRSRTIATLKLSDKQPWILDLPQPQPIPRQSQISDRLKGYDPFPGHLAENELGFLFGEVSGFWSGHPTYGTISSSFSSEVILADTGSGKTAFAYALTQIGNVGNPLERMLPILIAEDNVTLQNIQYQFARTLLKLVSTNSSILLGSNQARKKVLTRLLVNGLGPDSVKAHLAGLIEEDKNFADMIDQVGESPWQNREDWIRPAKEILDLLELGRSLLVIDFNQQNIQDVEFCLKNMQKWTSYSIITKLFLPKNMRKDFAKFQNRIRSLELTWSNEQISQMVKWRFESLSKLAGIIISPENLFDDNLYPQFIEHTQGNPSRLARLWRSLFDEHLNNSPDCITFSQENLASAVEKLKNEPDRI